MTVEKPSSALTGHTKDANQEMSSSLRSPAESPGLGCITFGYGLPLMRLGEQRPLTDKDLPPIRQQDNAELVVGRTIEAWQAEQKRNSKNPTVLAAITRLYRARLVISGLWCLAESAIRIVQPLLLRGFMKALAKDEVGELYCFASLLVVGSVLQAIIHHQLFFATMTLGWNLRIGMSGALHWKLLRLRSHTIQTGSADCYNLISNDVQRFDMGLPSLHFGWTAIVDIFAVAVFLILEIGWQATLSGVSVVLMIAVTMMFLGKRFAQRRRITAAISDERMKLTSQIVAAIMSIKVYCWEDAYKERVSKIRQREHSSIFKRQTMVSFNGAMYFSLVPLACLAVFLVFLARGEKLSLPLVYTVLSFILVLRLSVGKSFTFFISMVPEMLAAIGRLSRFMSLPEVPHSIPKIISATDSVVLQACHASFSWPSGSKALSNVSFKLKRGQLLVVTGPVGCGKSALLQSLLGDLDMDDGSFKFYGSIGYAPQTPWIMAGTLESNVLIGADMCDQAWYKEVIKACGLEEDIRQLGKLGDKTEIGERGVNLSGGQRARVGLARAVHAKPDVALLDDPLAAVDPAVAAHLVRNCIRGKVLASSAIVLCTHQESVFGLADTLLLLSEDGRVRACGPPQEVAAACGLVLSDPISIGEDLSKPVNREDRSREVSSDTEGNVVIDNAALLVKPEDTKQGRVHFQTYLHFARLAGFHFTVLVFLLFFFSQACMLFSNYWLGVWAQADDQDDFWYMLVFVVSAIITICFACLRSIMFYHTAMRASSSLHSNALHQLLHTHLGFFTANPHGRILNRFSGDLGNVDELLSMALHEVMDLGFIAAGTIILICVSVPPMIVALVPLFYYMLRLRRFVVKSMTELKRIDSMSRSPICDCFNSTLKGITPIRAFGRQLASQERIVSLLQRNAEPWFWWLITNRFIGFRLDMLSAGIMGITTLGGAALRNLASAELIGLAIVNAIALSGLFQYMVRQSALVESFMTSFERLLVYSRLPSEPHSGAVEPKPGFPQGGAIEISGLKMRYRDDLPEVLKGVTFNCRAGIKVGICGRTGSGKSSIFMALARLTDNTAGTILIDGVDASQLPLWKLRRCIAWVPQEPNFFSGSVRLNLDPVGAYSDEEILVALRNVQMTDALGAAGLECEVAEAGSNFSIGEQQLLSLCRALLQRRKILCMDEAFANVDFATDSKVQVAIRAVVEGTGATVLVVAHRMQTLADSDHLVVMNDGVVVEQGRPKDLLDADGAYAAMVRHAKSSDRENCLHASEHVDTAPAIECTIASI